MNELQIFENEEFGAIRTVTIDGEPWFVGKDVSEALGYADQNKAIAMHVDEEDKLNDKTASSLGQRGGWFINESGVYSLSLMEHIILCEIDKGIVANKPYKEIYKDCKERLETVKELAYLEIA